MSDINLEKIADKVRKLLALAQGNSNEAEATAAAQKAQDLLAAYNLDMSSVGSSNAEESAREKNSLMGGTAEWQRQLWAAVAKLNFCMYFYERKYGKKRENGPVRLRWHHVVIGRKINVLATKLMCEYLEETIDRLTREEFHGRNLTSSPALAFREGIADRIRAKIHARRADMIKEEAAKAAASTSTGNTKNALVLASYTQAEEDANRDLLYGEGYSARSRAKVAEMERAWAAADEAEKAWRAANPEAAAKKDAEAEKDRRKQKSYKYKETGRDRRRNSYEYYAGYEKGANVSLDKQVKSGGSAPIKQLG